MRRIKKKSSSKFSGFLQFCLGVIRAIKKGILWMIAEQLIFVMVLGFAFIFHSLGASDNLALVLSICLLIFVLILILILVIKFFPHHKPKRVVSSQLRGEEKLANWISRNLEQKAPQEWEEYQDWLHDILFDRFQLLERGFPAWKVRIITYWRLVRLSITVSLIKLRRLANVVKKLR